MISSSIPVAVEQPAGAQPATTRAARCSAVGRAGGAHRQRRLGQRRGEEEVVGLVELGQRVGVAVDVRRAASHERQQPGRAAELGAGQRVGLEVAVGGAEPLPGVG